MSRDRDGVGDRDSLETGSEGQGPRDGVQVDRVWETGSGGQGLGDRVWGMGLVDEIWGTGLEVRCSGLLSLSVMEAMRLVRRERPAGPDQGGLRAEKGSELCLIGNRCH